MIVSWPPLISACQSHLTGDKSGEKNWLLQGGPLVICKDWVILYLSRTYGDTRSVHLKHGFLAAAAGLKCVSSVSPFSFLFVKSNDMAEGRQVDIGTQSCRASFDDCNLDVGCQWRLPWRWTWRRTAAVEDANNRQCHFAITNCHSKSDTRHLSCLPTMRETQKPTSLSNKTTTRLKVSQIRGTKNIICKPSICT